MSERLPPDKTGLPRATLNHVISILHVQGKPIAVVRATNLLNYLRRLTIDYNGGEQDFKIALISNALEQEAIDHPYLRHATKIVLRALISSGFGNPDSLFFVRKVWSANPSFHIDVGFLTIIFPLRDAPTLYTMDEFASDPAQASKRSDLPLDTIAHTGARGSPIFSTGPNEIVFLKGAAWSGCEHASVHSAPSGDVNSTVRELRASAFIVEYKHPVSIIHR